MPIQILPDPATSASKTVTVTKTRPADTVTYTAGDAISESTSAGTVWTFAGMGRQSAYGGIIQSADLIGSTDQALKLDAELWLFDTAPATTLNDNVAWAPTDAELKTLLAVLKFSTTLWNAGSGNGITELKGLSDPYACIAGATSIYGVLRTKNAYIPTSAEDWTIRLRVLRD